jgi:hypothetical protein
MHNFKILSLKLRNYNQYKPPALSTASIKTRHSSLVGVAFMKVIEFNRYKNKIIIDISCILYAKQIKFSVFCPKTSR